MLDLQRADEVQLDAGKARRASAGHLASASCTRFSPKTRWPSASTASMRSSGCTLETATRVTAPAGRPAPAAAAAMRADDVEAACRK